ncbi:MAG: PepSY-associated TM helix domain-containing protein [Flavobacteriales bacterium]
MKKIKINRKLFAIHSWLGLILGVIFAVISFSGASIVFMHELQDALYGDDITVEKSDQPKLSYDELLEIGKKEFPNSKFINIGYDPDHLDQAYFITGDEPSEKGWLKNGNWKNHYVNPYTGEIMMTAESDGTNNILGWLDSMHVSLRLGSGGVAIVGFMAVGVVLSLITGLIFYRKSIWKVLTFKTRIKFKNWRTISSDTHRVIGTWALLINFCIFGTGIYYYYPVFTPTWWSETSTEISTPAAKIVSPQLSCSLDSLMNNAKSIYPHITPSYISIPCDTSRTINIYGASSQKLVWNIDNSASFTYTWDGVLKEKSFKTWDEMGAKEKFDNVNFTMLHTGWAWGIVGKILWTIFGFAPAILSITGFLLWWRKKRGNKNLKKA